MTLYDLTQSWDYIKYPAKLAALKKLTDYLSKYPDDQLIKYLLMQAESYEQEDYFGTEGLQF